MGLNGNGGRNGNGNGGRERIIYTLVAALQALFILWAGWITTRVVALDREVGAVAARQGEIMKRQGELREDVRELREGKR